MPTRPWPIATFAALIIIAFLAPSVLAQANTAQENKTPESKAPDTKAQDIKERWYILELAGSPAGHMSSITTTAGEGDAIAGEKHERHVACKTSRQAPEVTHSVCLQAIMIAKRGRDDLCGCLSFGNQSRCRRPCCMQAGQSRP
jgi:hypothetical protein